MRFLSVQPRNRTVPVYYITKTKNIQAGEEDFLKAGCKYDIAVSSGGRKKPSKTHSGLLTAFFISHRE